MPDPLRPEPPRDPRGWGFLGRGVSGAELESYATLLAGHFGTVRRRQPAPSASLPASRVRVPAGLDEIVSTADELRQLHATGRSFVDVARLWHGTASAPDAVATPRDAAEVTAVLEWCAGTGLACIPFGGGTSVVGGVDAGAVGLPAVTLQTRRMERVTDVDGMSLAARIEAGATGPRLEQQLAAHGLTLRFFPQSFELSTLGGWIATRAAGHFASGPTHIDDLVESVEAVTPAGVWTSRRLPASGAGPSPDRMLLGSEGTLGVVTAAWVRVQRRPTHRSAADVTFTGLPAALGALRSLLQAGHRPAGCRVLDATEALLAGVGDRVTLLLAFEGMGPWVRQDAAAALEACLDGGGTCADGLRHDDTPGTADDQDTASGRWRSTFLRAPYLRDALLGLGFLSETFETAVTWDACDELIASVLATTADAARRVCGDAIVTCRVTHAYADGAAPYFTVIAPCREGDEVAQWREVKAAAADALLDAGGTITHHHAVGRDHRQWYDRQRPEPFAVAFAAAKAALDPAGVLNPGVLIG